MRLLLIFVVMGKEDGKSSIEQDLANLQRDSLARRNIKGCNCPNSDDKPVCVMPVLSSRVSLRRSETAEEVASWLKVVLLIIFIMIILFATLKVSGIVEDILGLFI